MLMKKLLLRLSLLCTMCLFALGVSAAPDKDYLCFTANEANSTVTLNKSGNPNAVTLKYSTDGSTWNNYSIGNAITLSSIGSKVYFRNEASNGFSKDNSNCYKFAMTGSISASGNVMSLVDKNCETLKIPCDYCFCNLFYSCSSLTTPPQLPATTLAKACYGMMFAACSSLTTAPELPATTLAESCYSLMFFGCSSLTTAPELPATTLAKSCYSSMFSMSGLTTAPELPVMKLTERCYSQMFDNCSNLTTAPELPATTLAVGCYLAMFENCSNLTTAPELPATTLANTCYYQMFSGCKNLNFVKAAFTKWGDLSNSAASDYYATTEWLNGISSTGTFICSSELDTITRSASNLPEGWNMWSPENTTSTSAYAGESVTFTTAYNQYVDDIKYYVKKNGGDYGAALAGNTYPTTEAGEYTVKVEANDDLFSAIKVAEKSFTVKALPEITELTVTPESCGIGSTISFAATPNNFVGKPTITYYVKKSTDEEYPEDPINGNTFTPTEVGTYNVRVLAECDPEPYAEKEVTFEVLPQFDLTVSELGWASLYFNEDLVIPADTKAYYASEQSGDLVTLLPIKDNIPKNTAVIVKAEPGKYIFPFAEEDVDALEETNLFTGLLEDTPTSTVQALSENVGKSLYVLAEADKDGMPVFKIYNGETLGAYKMYMPINGGAEIKFVVKGDDFADGIVNFTDEAADSRMYNTMGMPVSNSYEGIILKGGKKFMNIKR